MSVKKYDFKRHYEQVRVTEGEHIAVLEAVCRELYKANGSDVTWRTEGDTLVFEWPMGDQLTGGEDFFEED